LSRAGRARQDGDGRSAPPPVPALPLPIPGVHMPHFGRILSALVTPFDAAGAVDHDVAQPLAKHLVAQGHEGLVVCGTTGESPTLSDDEKLGMFAAVVEAVDVPIIA